MGKDDNAGRKEEIAEIVAAAVKAALEAFSGPVASTPEERFEAFSKQVHPEPRPSTEHVERLVPCRSPITSSTFVARVVKSRTYPAGRVVELIDYTQPAGFDVPKSEGGLFSDGVPIRGDSSGGYSVQFNKWAWEEFWRKDLVEFVGKPFQSHIERPV